MMRHDEEKTLLSFHMIFQAWGHRDSSSDAASIYCAVRSSGMFHIYIMAMIRPAAAIPFCPFLPVLFFSFLFLFLFFTLFPSFFSSFLPPFLPIPPSWHIMIVRDLIVETYYMLGESPSLPRPFPWLPKPGRVTRSFIGVLLRQWVWPLPFPLPYRPQTAASRQQRVSSPVPHPLHCHPCHLPSQPPQLRFSSCRPMPLSAGEVCGCLMPGRELLIDRQWWLPVFSCLRGLCWDDVRPCPACRPSRHSV